MAASITYCCVCFCDFIRYLIPDKKYSFISSLQFPADYYQSLLLRVGELSSKVRDDIEKDVDR
jgi:hypothetical protein